MHSPGRPSEVRCCCRRWPGTHPVPRERSAWARRQCIRWAQRSGRSSGSRSRRPREVFARYRSGVVAQMSLPVVGAVSLGSGAVLTLAGYEDAACPPGPGRATCQHQVRASANGGTLASVVPGPEGQAAINRYFNSYRSLVTLATRPDLARQLRRSSQLPAPLRRGVGAVRNGDATPPVGCHCFPATTRDRIVEGAGVRERPSRLDGVLAGDHVGRGRHRDRCSLGYRDRPGRLARVREQPGCGPGLRRPDLARLPGDGRGTAPCESDRDSLPQWLRDAPSRDSSYERPETCADRPDPPGAKHPSRTARRAEWVAAPERPVQPTPCDS